MVKKLQKQAQNTFKVFFVLKIKKVGYKPKNLYRFQKVHISPKW